MTQQEKEQRLLDEAEKAIDRQKFDRLSDTIIDYQQVWIDGVKSEAAREYWQSQQKQEIDPIPTNKIAEMIEDIRKQIHSDDIEPHSLKWHVLVQKKTLLEGMLFMPEFNLPKKQETPELEDLRIKFKKEHDIIGGYGINDKALDVVFNFFAQYIKGTEWVSVKDRLPEDRQIVHVFGLVSLKGNEREVYRSTFYKDGDKFLHGPVRVKEVTHWQPLPKAPKEVGGE